MQSLGRKLRKVGEKGSRQSGRDRRDVLYSNLPPRAPKAVGLQRVVRRIEALNLPRFSGAWAAGCFVASWVVYGTFVGGHLTSVGAGVANAAGYVTARAGFGIESVQITGHRETDERDLVQALDLDDSTSLLTFDPFSARDRLIELPWVKTATVQKLFPDTIRIEVEEREAFALWQIGGMVQMVDQTGATIGPLTDERFAGLPLVVGYGANRAAEGLVSMIRSHPRLAARFRAAVRVADRRWNLRFDNGVDIRLPEDDAAGAIATLARLDEERELLSRDIVSVDMRLTDRISVRLTDPAAVQRKANTKSGGRAAQNGADT